MSARHGFPDERENLGVTAADHEEQLLAALCVIRHSAATESAWELFAMLGLEDSPELPAEPGPKIAPMLAFSAARSTKGKKR